MGNYDAVEAAQLVEPGLTLDELAALAPRIKFRPKPLLRGILASEVAAGRILETNGAFALNPERWPADQIAALRELRHLADALGRPAAGGRDHPVRRPSGRCGPTGPVATMGHMPRQLKYRLTFALYLAGVGADTGRMEAL